MVETNDTNNIRNVNIVIIGCGWWSQGWHIQQLSRNTTVTIVAFVDKSLHPSSSLNPNLLSLHELSIKYSSTNTNNDTTNNQPILYYTSIDEMLHDIGNKIDGVIIATPHSTHSYICQKIIKYSIQRFLQQTTSQLNSTNVIQKKAKTTPITILLEKPMTTNVQQAYTIHTLVQEYEKIVFGSSTTPNNNNNRTVVLLNHSANYRQQTIQAKEIIDNKIIGTIRYISLSFISPLLWIFDNQMNVGWNSTNIQQQDNDDNDDTATTTPMLGNGLAWGQSSHILAWIYYVCSSIQPIGVYCTMNHSTITNADISHSATITCKSTSSIDDDSDNNTIIINLCGTSLLPGNAHSIPAIPKEISIQIYGTNGVLTYSGNDCNTLSGQLKIRTGTINNNTTTKITNTTNSSCADTTATATTTTGTTTTLNNENTNNHDHDTVTETIINNEFVFEDLATDGLGPQSLQTFINACIDNTYNYNVVLSSSTSTSTISNDRNQQEAASLFSRVATTDVGYKTIQTINGMYTSHHTKQFVSIE